MKFFTALREFRKNLLFTRGNRDFEYIAELEDHPIGDQDIYRLYYVNYHRILEYDGRTDNNIGIINWCCKPFKMPAGVTREEGFKILSYLTDFIERRSDTEKASWKSVRTLDGVLDLERFGFQRVEENDESKIIDLFTVDGRVLLFKEMSEHYPRYFNWYVDGVLRCEVEGIYAKNGMEFKDIVWRD